MSLPIRQHIDIVAYLHLALGGLGVLAALLVFGVMGGAGLLSGDAGAAATLGVVGGLIAGVAALLSMPALLGGWGLLRRKPWARVLVMIVSVLNLFGFPLGTAVGGYSLWVLMQDEARAQLQG